MSVVAVICELNPPHNGHKYIFEKAKELSGSDFLVAVMSGNYVQRGEPAIIDKYERTRMALLMGADLVLELNSPYAFQSAREFASAAVKLCAKSGIIDSICFGSECADMQKLSTVSQILQNEPKAYKEHLQKELKGGSSYPKASEDALKAMSILDKDEDLLSPNNILALEYIRANELLPSPLRLYTTGRLGDSYSAEHIEHESFASATAIRGIIKKAHSDKLSKEKFADLIESYVPKEILDTYIALYDRDYPFLSPDRLSSALSLRLMDSLSSKDFHILNDVKNENLSPSQTNDLCIYQDVSSDIAARLLKSASVPLTFTERIEAIKNKSLTYSRIRRALLNIILSVSSREINELKSSEYIEYIRILGFKKSSMELLAKLKESTGLPMISTPAKQKELILASLVRDDFYYALQAHRNSGSKEKHELYKLRSELSHKIIVI